MKPVFFAAAFLAEASLSTAAPAAHTPELRLDLQAGTSFANLVGQLTTQDGYNNPPGLRRLKPARNPSYRDKELRNARNTAFQLNRGYSSGGH